MPPSIEIPTGMTHTRAIVVTEELTIARIDPRLPAVYGTPAMIMLMETTAAELLQRFMPEGFISVGVLVHVRHLAATPVGATVVATARITEVSDSTISFDVSAHDDCELIGEGTHRRAIVELSRFRRGVERKQAPTNQGM